MLFFLPRSFIVGVLACFSGEQIHLVLVLILYVSFYRIKLVIFGVMGTIDVGVFCISGVTKECLCR